MNLVQFNLHTSINAQRLMVLFTKYPSKLEIPNGHVIFGRLYIFNEPIGRMAELMDLDMGLGPHGQQILEEPMVDEEKEIFKEIMKDGYATLDDTF